MSYVSRLNFGHSFVQSQFESFVTLTVFDEQSVLKFVIRNKWFTRHPFTLPSNMECHPPPLETGPRPVESNAFVYQGESECTQSKECLNSSETHHHQQHHHRLVSLETVVQRSSTPELALLNSTMTSNARSKTSGKRTRSMNSSKTLDLESTSRGGDSIPSGTSPRRPGLGSCHHASRSTHETRIRAL